MQEEKFALSTGDDTEIFITAADAASLDVVTSTDGSFHILKNGKSYRADLVSFDFEAKTVHIRLNGTTFPIRIRDAYDLLIQKMGLSAIVVHKIKDVKAPMPGLVLNIAVQPGQEVAQGDALVILEAMKMENTIKSPGEGRVKLIRVHQGQAVEKGNVLIEME